MQFSNFVQDFNETYFNHSVQFQDNQTGDGVYKTLQLNLYPISSHSPYKPIVKVNSVTQVENTDYVVDYDQGIINWVTAPPNTHTIVVDAYYQKANLIQLVRYFNLALFKLAVEFPNKVLQEINYTDVDGAEENDSVKEINKEKQPFSDFLEIKEIIQYRNDWRGVEFIERHNFLLLDAGTRDDELSSVGVGSDYGMVNLMRPRSRKYSYLKYPYYIVGLKKYPSIRGTDETALTEIITLKDWAYDQCLVLTAINMYMSRRHYSEQINAATLRISSTMDLDRTIKSLSFQLINNLRSNAIGRGYTPDHRSYFSKKD